MQTDAADNLSARLQTTLQPERILYAQGFLHVAGADEVGRGPLAGPVVAAAVILPPDWKHAGIKDSKKLTARRREELFAVIADVALSWNWAAVEPAEIDRINILRASLLAMQRATESLSPRPDYLIVDGQHRAPTAIPQTPITRGDARSRLIAAASIMAKVVRDAIMDKYHRLYPAYRFADNKGYGTAAHLEALALHGCCPVHRRSFKRVVPPK